MYLGLWGADKKHIRRAQKKSASARRMKAFLDKRYGPPHDKLLFAETRVGKGGRA